MSSSPPRPSPTPRPSPALYVGTGVVVVAFLLLVIGSAASRTEPMDDRVPPLVANSEAVSENVVDRDRLGVGSTEGPNASPVVAFESIDAVASDVSTADGMENDTTEKHPTAIGFAASELGTFDFSRIRRFHVPIEIHSERWGPSTESVVPRVVGRPLPARPRPVIATPRLAAMAETQAVTLDIYTVDDDDLRRENARDRYRRMLSEVRARERRERKRLEYVRKGRVPAHPIAAPNPTAGPFWEYSRGDLDGLPLLDGNDCLLEPTEAGALRVVSTEIGRVASRIAAAEFGLPPRSTATANDVAEARRREAFERMWDHVHERIDEHGHLDPSGLHQVLQVAPVRSRLHMVATLAKSDDVEATQALVQRALFDLDEEVRRTAVEALGTRPDADYESRLLAAFDHPWEPAAEHAADALVALERTDLIDELRAVAERPDPRAPFVDEGGRSHVRELARVNHLRNCLMCHAPKVETTLVARPTGAVPDPYAPLPNVYYGDPGRLLLVRADVTYLWQDFSLVHVVEEPERGWPNRQRFDYFVRTRRLTDAEAEDLAACFPRERSPQRLAARYAVESLEILRERNDRTLLTLR